MKYLTEQQANKKMCPLAMMSSRDNITSCQGSRCALWVEVLGRVEREDHSNGYANMAELACSRNQVTRREGPSGCGGLIILDAIGCCGLIYKGEK